MTLTDQQKRRAGLSASAELLLLPGIGNFFKLGLSCIFILLLYVNDTHRPNAITHTREYTVLPGVVRHTFIIFGLFTTPNPCPLTQNPGDATATDSFTKRCASTTRQSVDIWQSFLVHVRGHKNCGTMGPRAWEEGRGSPTRNTLLSHILPYLVALGQTALA